MQTGDYYQAGRPLETGLACAFSTTETTVWTTTAAATATIAEIAASVQFLFEIVVRIQLFLRVFVRFRLKTCSNVCIVAPTKTKLSVIEH